MLHYSRDGLHAFNRPYREGQSWRNATIDFYQYAVPAPFIFNGKKQHNIYNASLMEPSCLGITMHRHGKRNKAKCTVRGILCELNSPPRKTWAGELVLRRHFHRSLWITSILQLGKKKIHAHKLQIWKHSILDLTTDNNINNISNNNSNNNVVLSCAHQCSECSHHTY